MLPEALISSEHIGNAAHGLLRLILMHTEIDWVDIYLGLIFLRAPDHEVVREQSQGACVGLYCLLCMSWLGRSWCKSSGFRLSKIYLRLLGRWLLNKRSLDFLCSFLFLFVNLLRSSWRFCYLLLDRLSWSLLSSRLSLSSSCLRLKWIKFPARFLFFVFFNDCPLIFSCGADLIELIVLSVIVLISFSLITHT